MLKQRQMELVGSVEPDLRSRRSRLRPLRHQLCLATHTTGKEKWPCQAHQIPRGTAAEQETFFSCGHNNIPATLTASSVRYGFMVGQLPKRQTRLFQLLDCNNATESKYFGFYSPHLEVTEQVLEGGGVWNDGGLVAAVNCSHQGEGEVEDVAVEQRALLLQQHSQQLQGIDSRSSLTAEICL